jgi:hypothetical protein
MIILGTPRLDRALRSSENFVVEVRRISVIILRNDFIKVRPAILIPFSLKNGINIITKIKKGKITMVLFTTKEKGILEIKIRNKSPKKPIE